MDKQAPMRRPPGDTPDPAVERAPAVQPAPIELKLSQLQDQFDRLKAQVRQAQQLANLGTAATTIAHEVSNLLTPIQSYAQAALETGDVELQKKALAVTLKHVRMLVEMSDRVLEIGAAKEPNQEPVPVRAVVNDAYASLCRDVSKDGIRFTVDVDDSVTAWADALQLQQVLFNLFLNAREALRGNHNGRLAVSAVCQGGVIVIKVRNTGSVIPPALLPRVFEPFQTSKPVEHNGRQRCGGLGLALCRDLIEENHGTISVTSEPQAGTVFTVTLRESEAVVDC